MLELVNDCDETVLSSGVDFEGKEQSGSVALARSTLNTRTWVNHVFRLRLADGKRTLLREVVVPDVRRA